MKEAFDSIKKGLNEAIDYARGDRANARVTKINFDVDVKRVRTQMGMTQKDFAFSFGINLGTLRHWERGDRKPKGPALVLLNLVERDPQIILKLLSAPS